MGSRKGLVGLSRTEFARVVQEKRMARMASVDRMPSELRELVHEYGLTVVHALTGVGVTKPKHIKHVVETVLNEFSPTRGSYSSQGVKAQAEFKGWSHLNDQ